jgi:predicted RNase H-like HicB family nuclease
MAQYRYDPERAPDPEWWLALDEHERMHLVEEYHRKTRVRLPNATAHAVFHVIIENQVALGSEIPVAATLTRLMKQGLDRHEALHAIASVLAGHMHALFQENSTLPEDPNVAYYAALAKLTPRSWRAQFR